MNRRLSKYWRHHHCRLQLIMYLSITPEIEKQAIFLAVFPEQEILKRSRGEWVRSHSIDIGAVALQKLLRLKTISWSYHNTHWRQTSCDAATSHITTMSRHRRLHDVMPKLQVIARVWHRGHWKVVPKLKVPISIWHKRLWEVVLKLQVTACVWYSACTETPPCRISQWSKTTSSLSVLCKYMFSSLQLSLHHCNKKPSCCTQMWLVNVVMQAAKVYQLPLNKCKQ